jgi:serine/threonine-protein kinase
MPEARHRFAELAVSMKLLSADQAREGLREQARLRQFGGSRKIGEVLVDKGWMDERTVQKVLIEQVRRRRKAKQTKLTDGTGKLGNYELMGTLGKGAMGAVYKARDTMMDRFVAIKVLSSTVDASDDFLKRFQREIRIAGSLNHPNVVCAYDAGKADGMPYLAMELVMGETLKDRLKRKGRMAETTALEIIRQVASGLAHAHAKGLVHRDIKPANILLDRSGVPKVADMGLAKSVNEDEKLTRTGVALGTPQYMPPEQATGDKQLDHRSDIYSLGATLYHLLTGKPPFDGENRMAIMQKHVSRPVPPPRQLAPELTDGTVALVKRMMAKKPDDRFDCCEDLVEAIQKLLGGRKVLAPRQPPVRPADPASPMITGTGKQAATGRRGRVHPRGTRPGQPARATRPRPQKSGCMSILLVTVTLTGVLILAATPW